MVLLSTGSIGGADRTFACKSQECLWQDWYILASSDLRVTSSLIWASILHKCPVHKTEIIDNKKPFRYMASKISGKCLLSLDLYMIPPSSLIVGDSLCLSLVTMDLVPLAPGVVDCGVPR